MGESSYQMESTKRGGTFDEFCTEVDRLTEVIDRFEIRLTPVLHNTKVESSDPTDSDVREVMSPVSELRERLSSRVSRLQRLSERIDL